ncbi:MAG: hypothetical protein ACI8W7_003513 [Gammaproteobacteria bacterium]
MIVLYVFNAFINNMTSARSRPDKSNQKAIRGRLSGLLLLASVAHSSALLGGEPGRLEADADFILGRWSSNCADGEVDIFLRDGALRQNGLLRLVPKGGAKPVTPVTLLAATRDGPGLVLEASSEQGGFRSSARYTAHVGTDNSVVLKSMTLCREQQCRSVALDVPWRRCAQ